MGGDIVIVQDVVSVQLVVTVESRAEDIAYKVPDVGGETGALVEHVPRVGRPVVGTTGAARVIEDIRLLKEFKWSPDRSDEGLEVLPSGASGAVDLRESLQAELPLDFRDIVTLVALRGDVRRWSVQVQPSGPVIDEGMVDETGAFGLAEAFILQSEGVFLEGELA